MLMVLVLLQLSIIFILLIFCLWQCYTNHTLRTHLSHLATQNHTPPSPPLPNYPKIESLGEFPRLNGIHGSTKAKSTFSSRKDNFSCSVAETVTSLQRSSSASHLSDLGKSSRIQTKLSQSDYTSPPAGKRGVAGNGRGVLLHEEEEEEGVWLGSSSWSSLDNYTVSNLLKTT